VTYEYVCISQHYVSIFIVHRYCLNAGAIEARICCGMIMPLLCVCVRVCVAKIQSTLPREIKSMRRSKVIAQAA